MHSKQSKECRRRTKTNCAARTDFTMSLRNGPWVSWVHRRTMHMRKEPITPNVCRLRVSGYRKLDTSAVCLLRRHCKMTNYGLQCVLFWLLVQGPCPSVASHGRRSVNYSKLALFCALSVHSADILSKKFVWRKATVIFFCHFSAYGDVL